MKGKPYGTFKKHMFMFATLRYINISKAFQQNGICIMDCEIIVSLLCPYRKFWYYWYQLAVKDCSKIASADSNRLS